MNKIRIKKYARISFILQSPLMLGATKSSSTDKDLIKDHRGIPYIPASSIAGVCRGMFESDKADKYFGYVEIARKANQETKSEASSLVFYNATLTDEDKFIVSNRDCVALDDCKVAKKGAKFDMEVLEPGVRFVTYMEQNLESEGDENIFEDIVQAWLSGEMRFGGKTMRGYGDIGQVEVRTLTFDMENAVDAWLAFDMYEDEDWKSADIRVVEDNATNVYKLQLKLEQAGGISIRKYTTKVAKEGEAMPDYEQLTVTRLSADGTAFAEYPAIPGTSWAGAFLHQMRRLNPGWKADKLFGYVSSKKSSNESKKSRIRFSESEITGAIAKTSTRNAIDRFSGGTTGTALFTEKTYYNGTTELTITVPKDAIETSEKHLLAAAICDLHKGYLAVGGLTAVGRGLFRITEINGNKVEDDLYHQLIQEMEGEC